VPSFVSVSARFTAFKYLSKSGFVFVECKVNKSTDFPLADFVSAEGKVKVSIGFFYIL
jgi:hypothetical protein